MRFRDQSGQAASEYVGVVAVVALILAGAVTTAAAPTLGAKVLGAVRHGICTVAGGICSVDEARKAGLAPCVVQMRSDAHRIGASIAVLRLRRGDTLLVERRSDGSASVSFTDGNDVGAGLGVGLRATFLGVDARPADAELGASFRTGRAHEFDDWATAQRFIAAYAAAETTGGKIEDVARGISPLHERHRLPAPDETAYEAGGWAELEAELELPGRVGTPLGLEGEHEQTAAVVLGRKHRRKAGSTTYYVNLDASAHSSLGTVLGGGGVAHARGTVLELTVRRGEPVAAVVVDKRSVAGDFALYGQTTDLPSLGKQLRNATLEGGVEGAGGRTLETRLSLNLKPPASRAALAGVLDALRGRVAPSEWRARSTALAHSFDEHGRLELAVFDTRKHERELAVELALVAKLGIEDVSTQSSQDLAGAWSIDGGSTVRDREDCSAGMAV